VGICGPILRDLVGYLGGLGLVHVAAKKLILRADDDSLSGRSFANDVPVGCKRLSMQLAWVSDGVLDGEGIFSDRRRRRREEAGRVVRVGSGLHVRKGGLSSTLYWRLCGRAEGEVLGLPGAGVWVRSFAEIREDRDWITDNRIV